MPIRVAIMGFGRLGRNLFRSVHDDPDIHVVAINDSAEPGALEYLLRYDSLLGRFPEPARVIDRHLYVGGRRVPVLHEVELSRVPWFDYSSSVRTPLSDASCSSTHPTCSAGSAGARAPCIAPPATCYL